MLQDLERLKAEAPSKIQAITYSSSNCFLKMFFEYIRMT